jgi:hypothetical protein
LTAGVTRSLLRISLSSIVEGDVFNFLFNASANAHAVSIGKGRTSQSFASR